MKVLALALNDLRLVLAERGAFIARLVVPIAFTFVVGIANDAFAPSDGPPSWPVLAIEDLDQSELSRVFVDEVYAEADRFAPCSASDCADVAGRDDAALSTLLDESRAAVGITIPSGFDAALRAGNDVRVEVVFGVNDPALSSELQPILQAAAARATLAADAGIAARGLVDPDLSREGQAQSDPERLATTRAIELGAAQRVTLEEIQIELPRRYTLSGFQQSVPGMGSMFVLLGVLAGAAMLVEERRRWTLYRSLAAPLTRAGYVTGRVLGRFIVGMMQYVVAIATGLVLGLIFDISFGSSPLLMLAVMAAFVFAASGLSVMLATFVEREQHATSLTTLLAVTLAPIGGAWWSIDLEIVPDFMRQLAVISPFYWVIEGFKAAIYDLGFSAAALPLVILSAIGAVTIAIASRRLPRTL